ncbi:hypothetical protein [Natrinema pallidum]|nr:hypothetical protein [Natrinema pallidum]
MPVHPDACYRCPCGRVFVDAQIEYERHLARDHGRLRDTLPAVRTALNHR